MLVILHMPQQASLILHLRMLRIQMHHILITTEDHQNRLMPVMASTEHTVVRIK